MQVRADRLGATSIYAAEHYSRPALVPTMAHLPAKPLLRPASPGPSGPPTGYGCAGGSRPTATGPLGTATSYAVYRFDGPGRVDGCDRADAAHLVGTVRATPGQPQSWVDGTAEPGRAYTYQVTALDRLWNESRRLAGPGGALIDLGRPGCHGTRGIRLFRRMSSIRRLRPRPTDRILIDTDHIPVTSR